MPVPALSFATRYYNCNAGVMVTASHNPAKYNGYKAYGPDGCQMTDDAAAIVYEEIQKTDVLTGAKYMSFAEGVEEGLIRFVGDDCKRALYDAIESRQVRPGLCKTAGLKLVYSPLNGSGLVPVTQVLKDIGITDITIVPEQEYPNGYFTTCSYPNPEIFEALELGLNLAKESDADLMLATDPDADRVGIAMKCPDGSYELVSGNEVGVLLLDYICAGRIEKGNLDELVCQLLGDGNKFLLIVADGNDFHDVGVALMIAIIAALLASAFVVLVYLCQQSVFLTLVEEIIEHLHGDFVALIILKDDEIQFLIHFVTLLSSVY